MFNPEVITRVFPSPDAQPVDITAQSQVMTSYLLDYVWCVPGPLALVPTATLLGPPYLNESTLYETKTAGSGTCETVYVPTETTVCATTLTGLASKITVTDCSQEITFSSECGFTLETPTPTLQNLTSLITPAPTVKRMMTYWIAPWQSLTLGDTPSDVDTKICTILDNDTLECIRYQEVWEVVVVTTTTTVEWPVEVTTTVTGPGTLIIDTLQAQVTDTIAYIDLSTILLLETEISIETTSKSKKLVTRPEDELTPTPTATVYLTKLSHCTQMTGTTNGRHSPAETTIVRLTSTATDFVGTITRTRPRPRPTPIEVEPVIFI
ncbi:hypothetical protein BU24DRAFT_358997 [Aaosphaeria arxii CBS 175.79]|uniref:Uncharacterized protein n=1 Tax=Aaosphaeria arxii CBS 175.79 TaxID=1450172 RepID=A0A6A5X8L5_9PLEO|nr:uncharacterized protein BU24DRAFT_358997 [Aaosphaeria arxii CBS 175.79]KAF2009298.1 hypothetical protein BU24DRAFT_358997 [Aaosphaeria arxii CBS 175.79]